LLASQFAARQRTVAAGQAFQADVAQGAQFSSDNPARVRFAVTVFWWFRRT
jgi:hypothetical protein